MVCAVNYGLVKIHAGDEESHIEIEIRTGKNALLHKIKFNTEGEAS